MVAIPAYESGALVQSLFLLRSITRNLGSSPVEKMQNLFICSFRYFFYVSRELAMRRLPSDSFYHLRTYAIHKPYIFRSLHIKNSGVFLLEYRYV